MQNGGTIPREATDPTWGSNGLPDMSESAMRPLGMHSAAAELAGTTNGVGLDPLNGGGAPGSVFPTSAGKDPTTQVTPLAPLTLALDALCANRGRFLDKYVPLGLAHRRLGRTAVVQIFEDAETQKRCEPSSRATHQAAGCWEWGCCFALLRVVETGQVVTFLAYLRVKRAASRQL